MEIKTEDITSLLKQQLKEFKVDLDVSEVGEVLMVGDGVARVSGLENVMSSELVELPNGVFGMALNLEEDNVGLVLFGDSRLVKEGDLAKRTGKVVEVPVGDEIADDLELNKFTNQLIHKITNNLESFSYNVIVASMYEAYNFLIKHIEKNINQKDLLENYKKILTSFSPIIPHLTSECLIDIGCDKKLNWPLINKDYLKNENIDYVVQINGKKRTIINAEINLKEDKILDIAKNEKLLDKYLNNKSIKKVIFVKNRLINILVNE